MVEFNIMISKINYQITIFIEWNTTFDVDFKRDQYRGRKSKKSFLILYGTE